MLDTDRFLRLKFGLAFQPTLACLPQQLDTITHNARGYDAWTFAKLLCDLIQAFERDNPAPDQGPQRNVAILSTLSQGFSGSTVFGVELRTLTDETELTADDLEFRGHGRSWIRAAATGHAFILKIGPYKQILQEKQNYTAHVIGVMSSAVYPRLIASTSFVEKTGAILYERISDLRSLFDVYGTLDEEGASDRVDSVVAELRRSWYDSASPKRIDLVQHYQLPHRRDKFLQAIRQLVPATEIRKSRIVIPGPENITLTYGRNPFEVIDEDFGSMTILESVIHDDLSPYNVLVDHVDPAKIKFIDFALTGPKPILQDLAKFEMSTLFLLYDRARHDEDWCISPDTFSARNQEPFRHWLLTVKSLIDELDSSPTVGAMPESLEDRKLIRCVRRIRAHASEYAYSDWRIEYGLALLTWSLRATFWNDASPAKRLLAYYVACMIAERITAAPLKLSGSRSQRDILSPQPRPSA